MRRRLRAVTLCEGVTLTERYLDPDSAEHWFTTILALRWRQERLRLFGRWHTTPRLTAWFGEPGTSYTYSGVRHEANGMHAAVSALRDGVRSYSSADFNFVLLNRYRSGRDGMGWHADDEPELGERPFIASLSLGATRRFKMRRKDGMNEIAVDLESGSLLTMSGDCQRDWLHCVPKTMRPVGERINLTFRYVCSP